MVGDLDGGDLDAFAVPVGGMFEEADRRWLSRSTVTAAAVAAVYRRESGDAGVAVIVVVVPS
jgi:hypothetical protein